MKLADGTLLVRPGKDGRISLAGLVIPNSNYEAEVTPSGAIILTPVEEDPISSPES